MKSTPAAVRDDQSDVESENAPDAGRLQEDKCGEVERNQNPAGQPEARGRGLATSCHGRESAREHSNRSQVWELTPIHNGSLDSKPPFLSLVALCI